MKINFELNMTNLLICLTLNPFFVEGKTLKKSEGEICRFYYTYKEVPTVCANMLQQKTGYWKTNKLCRLFVESLQLQTRSSLCVFLWKLASLKKQIITVFSISVTETVNNWIVERRQLCFAYNNNLFSVEKKREGRRVSLL